MGFLINLMFSRLDKFDGPMFEGAYRPMGRGGGLIFEMLIGLHICGAYGIMCSIKDVTFDSSGYFIFTFQIVLVLESEYQYKINLIKFTHFRISSRYLPSKRSFQ